MTTPYESTQYDPKDVEPDSSPQPDQPDRPDRPAEQPEVRPDQDEDLPA